MEGKDNQLGRFQQFRQMMTDSLSQQQKNKLSQKLQSSIILIHTLNNFFGLQAINENDQLVEFDNHWAKGKQGVYKLRYQLKNQQGKKQTVLFRFIQQNDELNVNFCIQGQTDLLSYTIKFDEQQKTTVEKHTQQLQKILPNRKKNNQQNQPPRQPFLRPVPLNQGNQEDRPGYRPMPFNRPDNLPFNNPFGKEEYIGPNSSIFGNRPRDGPGLEGPNPLGRYDPVDPFDTGDRRDNPDDFQGFDQFGKPIYKPKLPKGPNFPGSNNPFNKQPPFGGGFGGGFGGFGGGFGGNQFF